MKKVDIVVAVRNEEESLPVFLQRVRELDVGPDIELGCIFIEDSSTDQTRPFLRETAKSDPRIKYIFLNRGFGQAAAIALGLQYSDADAMIMMDVDGGHPLELIPTMIAEFKNGASAVQAVRRKLVSRQKYRDLSTLLFNKSYKYLTGVDTQKQNVYYRLISKDLAKKLLANNRWKHFLRIDYTSMDKSAVKYVEFDASERALGVSKYNFKRLLKFAIIAVFSSISAVRFIIVSAILLLVSALFIALGLLVLPVLLLLFTGAIIVKFIKMSIADILDPMRGEILESSGG